MNNYYYWFIKFLRVSIFVFIVIDLVRDFYRYFTKKDKDEGELLIDFMRIGLFVVVFVIITSINISDYGIKLTALDNLSGFKEKLSYKVSNDEIRRLTEDIKDKYNINVYVNVYPPINNIASNYNVKCEVSDDEAIKYLKMLDEDLSIYNDLALWKIPNDFYLVSNIVFNTETDLWGLNTDTSILLDVHSDDITIHHEIFHSLNKLMWESEKKEFSEIEEDHMLTSVYAGTNNEEFLSESWGSMLGINLHTQHSAYLENLIPRFIKNLDEMNITIIDEAMKFDNDIYNSLSKNEKIIYTAIEKAYEGEKVAINGTPEEVDNAKNAYMRIESFAYGFTNLNQLDIGNNIVFSTSETDREMVSDIHQAISDIASIFSGIEDNVKQISEVYNYIANRLYEQDFEILKNYTSEKKAFIMSEVLKELGYETQTVYLEVNDKNVTLVKVGDNYYWNDPNLIKYNGRFTGLLMSTPQLKIFNNNCEVDEDINAFDSSLSTISKNCLYMDKYNKTLVDNYVIKEVKNNGFDAELYFMSGDPNVINSIKDYLIDSKGNLSRLLSIGIRNYKGCYYYKDDENSNILRLYGFISQ